MNCYCFKNSQNTFQWLFLFQLFYEILIQKLNLINKFYLAISSTKNQRTKEKGTFGQN